MGFIYPIQININQQYIDMLRQVHATHKVENGCFHDYLTGQSRLIRSDPSNKQCTIELPLNRKCDDVGGGGLMPRLLMISGNALSNSEGTFLSTSSDEATVVRSTIPICQCSCWEFYFPLSLYGVEMGVLTVEANSIVNQVSFQFVSSTARTVTFLAQQGKVKAWVNNSVPNKNSEKAVNFSEGGPWYPYVRMKGEGITVIFNPFTSTPNTSITHMNPFNCLNNQIPTLQNQPEKMQASYTPIKSLHQLGKHKLLLESSDNYYKFLHRNTWNHRFEFPVTSVEGESIRGLWNSEEYKTLTEFCTIKQLSIFEFAEVFHIQFAFQWLKYLIIAADKQPGNENYNIQMLLLEKLLILRPYVKKGSIPQPLYVCQEDYQPYSYSKRFFQQPELLHRISKANEQPWVHLEGELVAISENYICFLHNQTLSIYSTEHLIKKIFTLNVSEENKFEKSKFVKKFSEKDISIFKQTSSAPFVYKILSNCLKEASNEHLEAFDVDEKNLKELVNDFKIPEEDAVLALSQCGNIEEALVWLANPNRKVTRNKQQALKKMSSKTEQMKKNISILELSSNAVARLLLQVDNKIFILGLSPTSLSKYACKTEKGFINLSTFTHENLFTNLNHKNWYSWFNHEELVILDYCGLEKNYENVLYLAQEQGSIKIIFDEGGILMKSTLLFHKEKIYQERCSLEVKEDQEPLTEQFLQIQKVKRSINGELIFGDNWKNNVFNYDTVTSIDESILSNLPSKVEPRVEMAVKLDEMPNFFPKQEETTTFLPLLVEKGPPGCNLNYPICSILYPKKYFLANYPYALTLRNLHSKLMKVQEVVIERIGNHRNVNEVKEGYIYFMDGDSGMMSRKYKFVFGEKDCNRLIVSINEEMYWQYMIIEPTYSNGKKMPYEIGFVGAKGITIDAKQFKSALKKYIEQKVLINHSNQRLRYEIIQERAIPNNIFHFTLLLPIESSQVTIETQLPILTQTTKFDQVFERLDKEHNIIQLPEKQFITNFTKKRQLQLTVLKQIAKDEQFSFEKFQNNNIRKFVDILHFQEKLKAGTYEQILKKLLKNFHARKYLEEFVLSFGEGMFAVRHTYAPVLLDALAKQDDLKKILEDLVKVVPKFQNQEYKALQEKKIPHLLLQQHLYSPVYSQKVSEQVGSQKKCQDIYESEQITQFQVISLREEYVRKLIIKLNGKHSISNILLRVQRSEHHAKGLINVYAHENGSKRQIQAFTIPEHQWIQIMKNPYQEEMMEMFGENKGWLNGYGIDLKGRSIEAQFLEIQIFFTASGVVAEKRESQNVPFIDIVPELYGNKISSEKQPECYIDNLFNIKQEERFFLSTIHVSLTPLNKYLVSKGNLEYHYYESEEEKVQDMKKKVKEKVKQGEYESAVSFYQKMVEKSKQFSGKVGLDYCYTMLLWVLERIEKVGGDLGRSLLEVVMKKEIGPVQEAAFNVISGDISLLIQSLPYLKYNTPKIQKLVLKATDIENVLQLNDSNLASSLSKLIFSNQQPSSSSVTHTIQLSNLTHKHTQVLAYMLRSDCISSLFSHHKIMLYLTSTVSKRDLDENFLCKLSEEELETFIMKCRNQGIKGVNYGDLLDRLIGMESLKRISVDLIPLLFEQTQVQWDNLKKCISLCPEAEDMIYSQYLSCNRDSPELMIDLVLFHKNILHSAAASCKNSELFAAFLSQLFFVDSTVFMDTVLELPPHVELHEDIHDIFNIVLIKQCRFGGIQGCKMLTLQQNKWLNVAHILIKQSPPLNNSHNNLIRWYLLNNDYELTLTNPVNRSASVTKIKELSKTIYEYISRQKININQLLSLYNEMKDEIKQNQQKLTSAKYIELKRLQNGVERLLNNKIECEELTDVLVRDGKLLDQMIKELGEEVSGNVVKWESCKDVELGDDMEGFVMQGGKTQNLNVKDWQTYKSGSKSTVCKVSAHCRKFLLKPQKPVNMNKFVIGFNIQDNPEKNNLLPDKVELFGGASENAMHKVAQLAVIDDQHFYPFGVKVWGVNFNQLCTKYKNGRYAVLEVRVHTFGNVSCSDVLENYQKSVKNSFYYVSFLSIVGCEREPETDPSYTSIYMKLLSFLSQPEYKSTLDYIVNSYPSFKQELFPALVSILNRKVWDSNNKVIIRSLLKSLMGYSLPVIQQLISQPEYNNQLIKTLVGYSMSIDNVDIVLKHTIESNINKETVYDLIENINIISCCESRKVSRMFGDREVGNLLEKYEKMVEAGSEKANLLAKVISCILSTHSLYQVDHRAILGDLLKKQNRKLFYPIIAAFVYSSHECLDDFAKNNRLKVVTEELLSLMDRNSKEDKVVQDIYECANLLASLSTHQPIKEQMISEKLPLEILARLESAKSLLIQYPKDAIKYLISVFQSTCIESTCAESFSAKLIELMVKLPDISSAYHQYFIHEFFFPLINAYTGAPVTFLWKGVSQEPLSQVTKVLETLPIRTNDKVVEFENQHFALVEHNWTDTHPVNKSLLLRKANENLAYRKEGQWKSVGSETSVKESNQEWKLVINGEDTALKGSEFSVYAYTQNDKNLLTNQTLLRIKKPTIFGKNYVSYLPIAESIYDHLYLLPLEMSLLEVFKQVNICGFKINSESLNKIKVVDRASNKTVSLQTKIGDLYRSSKTPLVHVEIQAHSIFRDSTIEKIAKGTEEEVPAFIPQETIFKSFEKLKGLQKMIKVLMTCVKNWANAEQSKIWLQYLNQLESFSCFPIFSSIYMTKQTNVQLLFDLLSGLPDKEDSKKWTEEEKKSVKFLYDIIKNVFEVEGEQAIIVRNYAIKSGFYQTMLERLHLVTKEPKRQKIDDQEEQQLQVPDMPNLAKKSSEEEYKLQVKKKKGIGYGTDSSSNQKWDITGHEEARKEKSDQVLGLLKILEKFLSHPKFTLPKDLQQASFSSCLLPVLESSLRGGSLLEISKYAELFTGQLSFIKAITKNQILVPCLMEIPKIYEPKQPESIVSLLKTLEGTSKIFLSCLTGSVSEKTSQQIAKNIIQTYNLVEEAISTYKTDNVDEDEERRILQLPLGKKYPILMKDLRFDYVDMKDKSGKIKHHYSSSYQSKHTSPPAKTIRLAQELADISHALPIDHTNAIYVRCDKERVDFMQALIMGSNGTPYGHGAYLFDIYFEDSYPNNPPKVNLTTTGSGSIRFNPNLYNCGKVCLSLLGTWRGSAMENWDPKVSTLLQVLVSIQSIIMSEEVYFNEPGFEHEQGTVEGEKKNQAYSNIVRYGNIKFAMLENLKNPPKGFETVIKRHFYLKKDEVLDQCRKWLKYAQKREASYTGLVSDHNHNWSNTFNKSKNQYSKMLEKVIQELQQEIDKLPVPSSSDLSKKEAQKPKKEKAKKKKIEENKEEAEQIDVTYEKNKDSNFKELDINDEKVKDRWSRYIGAMGIEAVNKQSKANILLFGFDALGIEIAKNLVLSGCRKLSICDQQVTSWKDLSGQFYLSEEDIGKNRVDACLYKLQELNNYVRVQSVKVTEQNIEKVKDYHLVISTTHNEEQLIKLNNYCHENGIKLISVKAKGPYGYVFNDFGSEFEVNDKNGEETVEVMIDSITNEEEGLVTLLSGQRHSYEDGEAVRISEVKGMNLKEGEGSINGTIHKIKVKNQHSFTIGDTSGFGEYEGNGLVRNMKLPISVQFKTYEETMKEVNIDGNLQYYDFTKGMNNRTLHMCFRALNMFVKTEQRSPKPWNWLDSDKMVELVTEIKGQAVEESQVKYIRRFSFTCDGVFAPLCAFYGGLIAQEAFKAITSKYMPINQYFFTDFTEAILQLPKQEQEWKETVEKIDYKPQENRLEGLRMIVGDEVMEKIRNCRVFVVGSGAIGCQLLKNYAMINLATGEKQGEIIVTDPDHIETSNLNRQFLFREKHLQKPKSMTAAAAVKQMNKMLQGKIKAKLTKVCEATKDTFSNEFFESLNIVTNALDNIQARQYVDLRCVENKIALLESGTLSSKGHVQVIMPYKTETYGSKADPAEQGDIPHCTLKMFPEETLHCVEWARDIFGKTFTLKPKALAKIIETYKEYAPNSSEKEVLKDSYKMLDERPKNFDDCIYSATMEFYQFYRNDIKQLLYTYPLDAKTKDGKPFWKLPKRPPVPIEQICPENQLHAQFITSYAVLIGKLFNVPYPQDFRTVERRTEIANQASKIKIQKFVPSDKLAKEMQSEVDAEKDKQEVMEEKTQKDDMGDDEVKIFKEIKMMIEQEMGELKVIPEEFEKDDDGNGHIDLIHSMANLRASNYKLEPMDWITTKLKAGRITPALSTTTSCIAALQTIELVKYLKGCTLQQMRNSFINLAVPMVQTGEPGEVQKIKIHEDLITNIWQRWQIGPFEYKEIKMGELIVKIEEKYKINVKVLNIVEGGPIFSDLVLGLQSKKQEKEAFLKKKFMDVIAQQGTVEEAKNFIDLTLLMGTGDEIVKHVPTIRILIN